jgi:hypothetical protein
VVIMAVLLFVVGAITLMVGVGAIGFGIPINEFSFGNTLIMAGMTAAVGGLIVIGLGAVVAQLHRISETLSAGESARPARAAGVYEAPAQGRVPAGRMPLPSRSRPDAPVPGPPPVVPPSVPEAAEMLPALADEPVLHNPEAPLTSEHETLFASRPASATAPPPYGRHEPARGEAPSLPETAAEQIPRPPPPEPRSRATNFDAMWLPVPLQPEPPPASVSEPPDEHARDAVQAAPPPEPAAGLAEAAAGTDENAPRAAAILKSGVVDGMGYTLYVDGSIEAELPQGTLRFASINELRSHLEKDP